MQTLTQTQVSSLLCLRAGSALRFAVQTVVSPVSGGRVGVAKAVVMLVTDKSADDVKDAANEAMAAGTYVTWPFQIHSVRLRPPLARCK